MIIYTYSLAPFVCEVSGEIMDLSPSNIIVVQGEYLEFRCTVKGMVYDFHNSWNVSFPSSQQEININNNSTDPYRIAIYSINLIGCTFTHQLIIQTVPSELNGANLSCIESIDEYGMEPVSQQSTKISG